MDHEQLKKDLDTLESLVRSMIDQNNQLMAENAQIRADFDSLGRLYADFSRRAGISENALREMGLDEQLNRAREIVIAELAAKKPAKEAK